MNIADAFVAIKASLTGFEAELTKGVTKAADNAGKKAGDSLGKSISGRLKGAVDRAGGAKGVGQSLAMGLGLGGPLGLAVGGLNTVISTLTDAGRAASDFNETTSKLSAVFPEQAQVIQAWAKDSAGALGMSQQAALEAMGTFGNFLQAMGTATPAAADMSRAMVQLATDLGSFNNADPSEVLQALQSGLSGETEPLRRFGVDISDAAVQANLLATGVQKVGKGYTQAQKIQGRYNLIMKQTVTAQGDFTRTASGTANATRTQAAETENLKIKMGQMVNKVQNAAVTFATGGAVMLMDAIDGIGEAFHNLNRFMDSTAAQTEDTNKELMKLAATRGEDPALIQAYIDKQKEATAALDQHNKEMDEQHAVAMRNLGLNGKLNAEQEQQVQAWLKSAEGIAVLNDELGQNTVAVQDNLTEAERAQMIFSQYLSVADLAHRTGLRFDTMMTELNDRMLATGQTWVEALGAVGTEVNMGQFRATGTAAATELQQSYDTAVAAWLRGDPPGSAIATATTENIDKGFRDAGSRLAAGLQGMETLVDITREKIKNKSGKGWHWKRDISTQLTALKHQFSQDVQRIDYLMTHDPAEHTRSWVVKRIDVIERRRDRALASKDWDQFEESVRVLENLNGLLTDIDGREVSAKVLMSIMIGTAWMQQHPQGNVHAVPSGFSQHYPSGWNYWTQEKKDRYRKNHPNFELAKGGYAAAGTSGIVGETGPERLTMYSGGGGYVTALGSTVTHQGTSNVNVTHHLDAGSAAQLRQAGFDDRAVAGYMLAAPGQSARRWEDS